MKLHPYLMFAGTCEDALNFYKDIFDAEEKGIMRYSEMPPGHMEVTKDMENFIMHATIEFHGITMMLCDNLMPNYKAGNDCYLSLSIDDLEEATSIFNSLADGGNIGMPLDDTFWGGKFGMLTDKFGVGWMVSSEGNEA